MPFEPSCTNLKSTRKERVTIPFITQSGLAGRQPLIGRGGDSMQQPCMRQLPSFRLSTRLLPNPQLQFRSPARGAILGSADQVVQDCSERAASESYF